MRESGLKHVEQNHVSYDQEVNSEDIDPSKQNPYTEPHVHHQRDLLAD